MKSVSIRDIGPIERLVIPIPEDGGVVVLRGRNGSGKSEALESAQALLRGSGRLEVRDGQARGEVRSGDALLSVGRSTRRTGEMDVCHLEGRLDIGDLVDPGLKDPEAADARRIRALIALTGVAGDLDLFADLLPGGREKLEELLSPKAIGEKDLLEMARLIKKDLESAARHHEDQAEKEEGAATACQQAAEGVDRSVETDPVKLQSALEAAIGTLNRLQASAETAAEAKERMAFTEKQLATLKEAGLPDLQETAGAVQAALEELNSSCANEQRALDGLARAQQLVLDARQKRELCEQAHKAAEARHASAEQTLKTVATLEAGLKRAAAIEAPTEEALRQAQEAVQQARQCVEQGALARKAAQQAEEAEGHRERVGLYRAKAAGLRAAAKATDHVLSSAVACPQITVQGGRLMTKTGRGDTFFGDLSDGERWKIALDVAAERVGKGGIIVAPQHAWEGLDPENRQAVAGHAKELGVVVLTAEATDGELRAEEV